MNYRALFSLTVEELLLAHNVTDAEWNAVYRPTANSTDHRQATGLCGAIEHAGSSPWALAKTGQGSPDDSQGAREA